MNIKRYQARDMREALRRIREDQGPEAVILSSRKSGEGLEVISAVDFDQSLVEIAGIGRKQHNEDDRRASVEARRVDRPEEAPAEPPRDSRRNGVGFLNRLGYGRKQAENASDAAAGGNDSGSALESPEGQDPAPDHVTLSSAARVEAVASRNTRQSEAAPGPGAEKPADLAMRHEINALRRMLESQLSALSWHDFTRENPARTALLRDLIKLGLGRETSRKLAAEVSTRQDDLAYGWCQALGLISQRIAVTDTDPVDRGGVVALVGPTGAGKTTTVAKLAARHAMLHGPERVAMISADDFRVGSQEQLFAWGRMLNVPVFAAGSHEELVQRIQRLDNNRLILVDTAGVGASGPLMERVRTLVSGNGLGMRSLLVLPANAQSESLSAMAGSFRPCDLAGLVVTKLDEAVSLGGLLDALLACGWPVAYTCDGQDVPEHIRRASSRNMVRRAADLMKSAGSTYPEDPELALSRQTQKEYAFG
mgnify:CR=1 FL=1